MNTGALSVPCPQCHVRAGRPCHNQRGYLCQTHLVRYQLWLQLEEAETVPEGV